MWETAPWPHPGLANPFPASVLQAWGSLRILPSSFLTVLPCREAACGGGKKTATGILAQLPISLIRLCYPPTFSFLFCKNAIKLIPVLEAAGRVNRDSLGKGAGSQQTESLPLCSTSSSSSTAQPSSPTQVSLLSRPLLCSLASGQF